MDIALATGVTIDYDETDLKEHKRLSNYAFYSPSVEFYLKEEKDNYCWSRCWYLQQVFR